MRLSRPWIVMSSPEDEPLLFDALMGQAYSHIDYTPEKDDD